jgi:hypothetical protein
MDFVTAWKASSIVLTGAFGILGLVKEYKDKDTKKITTWGRISLAGILVSSTLGVMAQLKESSNQERDKDKTAKQTLALVQKTDSTVRDIQRLLSPLDEPQVSMSFDIDCLSDLYKSFCWGLRTPLSPKGLSSYGSKESHIWTGWPRGQSDVFFLGLNVFINGKNAQLFLDEGKNEGDLVLSVFATTGGGSRSMFLGVSSERVSLDVLEMRARITSNGQIRSTLDFSGVTLIVTEPFGRLRDLTLRHLEITLKNGQRLISDGPFEQVKSGSHGESIAFRYVFPSQH